MSKLRELVSKGVRLIVAEAPEAEDGGTPSASQTERDIPAEAFADPAPKEVVASAVPADVADFGAVYQEAGIELPLHGYGIDKVAEMLTSKRLATMGREVKAAAVLAALEAASVPIRDVLKDAVARDQALDAFEAAKDQEVKDLRQQAETRIAAIKDEIDAFLREKNAEIESLKKASEGAQKALLDLQVRKRDEEQRLHDLVSHFIEGGDNPITTQAAAKPPAGSAKPDPA